MASSPEMANPILIGEIVPNAKLLDPYGKIIELNNLIKNKKSILVFYRGGWCPYCNQQLSILAAIEEEIVEEGYQIIAISPEDFENLIPTKEMDKISYTLLSDPDGMFIQKMGLAYTASEKTKFYMSKKSLGKTPETLPIPSVMIVDTKGQILFQFISRDCKNRVRPELLAAVMKNIK